jgi:hypothetical protein
VARDEIAATFVCEDFNRRRYNVARVSDVSAWVTLTFPVNVISPDECSDDPREGCIAHEVMDVVAFGQSPISVVDPINGRATVTFFSERKQSELFDGQEIGMKSKSVPLGKNRKSGDDRRNPAISPSQPSGEKGSPSWNGRRLELPFIASLRLELNIFKDRRSQPPERSLFENSKCRV